MKIGIISSITFPDVLQNPESVVIETPYGSITTHVSEYKTHTLFFMHRHGNKATLPPHRVNYQGNIQAYAASHVDYLISVGTVGSMKTNIKPGDVIIPHDFIDVTKNRPMSFFDDQRVHVDMSEPFCPMLRKTLIEQCRTQKNITTHDTGVYLVTEGPRLETAAEIRLYASVADIVGMTLSPEVCLAKEKGICYASLCIVCNMAAGLQHQVSLDEIRNISKKQTPVLSQILKKVLTHIPERKTCTCCSQAATESL